MSEGCVHCIHEAEIAELKKDADRNSKQHREFYDRFAKDEMNLAISDERYNNLLSVMTEVRTSLNELKEKPAKKWDTVSMCIITTLVGGLVGFLVNGLF